VSTVREGYPERAAYPRPGAPVQAATLLSVSAVFHYLGPAFAVLLFSRIDVYGVALLRIAGAAVVFAVWRRPWRLLHRLTAGQRALVVAMGAVLAGMNTVFYLAIARLPLATVGAVEFLGVVVLAAAGARTGRNALAVGLAAAGVLILTDVRLAGDLAGFAFAFVNCGLFMLYVTLGHRLANTDVSGGTRWSGTDQLGLAMMVAAVVAAPAGIGGALPAARHPAWLLAGIGVGVCSSVIPYVADQFAMARLRHATFALMLSVLPASATVVGLVVLAQLPTVADLAGVALVIAAIATHRQPTANREERRCSTPDWARPG
jgi:inner membrane transporter RhtA